MIRGNKIGIVSLLLSLAVVGFGIDVTLAAAARSQGAATESAAAKSVDLAQSASAANGREQEEKGLSQKAEEIGRFLGFPITNSMMVSWIVALTLIVFTQVATRNMKPVPAGAQNLLEWLVEALYKFIEGIIGSHLTKRTFWFFATIFIFILSANWIGLIPGVGTIGWGHETAHGFKIDQPLFRGANADVNMTLAMALVFFALWIYFRLLCGGLPGSRFDPFSAGVVDVPSVR